MIRKWWHIVLMLFVVLAVAGCNREPELFGDGCRLELTVRCDNSVMTRAEEKDGEKAFNETLIESVDFLFYPGDNPDPDTDAVYHIRKEKENDATQEWLWSVSFNLSVKKDVIDRIFKEANQYTATVYVLVNFDKSFIESLSLTSRNELASKRLETDFAQTEVDYVQPKFYMDGKAVIVYDENGEPNVSEEIRVTRFASKLSVAIHVADEVVLKHKEELNEPDEYWTPVLHTMRIYLVDGVSTVALSSDGKLPDSQARDANPKFFSYDNSANRRPFLNEASEPYFVPEIEAAGTSEEKRYYNTWPMYSYPRQWSDDELDYTQVDYLHDGLPHEPPYLKLEMDWRREAKNGYAYDRRKYYYKVFMPFEQFVRNNWYGFYLDVAILGSESDEGRATLQPSCYLLDWQNKSLAINKYAVISKARYLSVDKKNWDINNMDKLSIPFVSSHNVTVVPGTVTATRPYYGEITTSQPVDSYHEKMHGWIREKSDGSYYLDYNDQPEGNDHWEPSEWLSNTSTSIVLDHPLVNDNTQDDFDYSVYTIDFDIVHTDLVDSRGSQMYSQFVQHITIVQRPGIYIERIRNSDTEIQRRNPKDTSPRSLYGYPDGKEPWADKPWGYAYVNGGRFIRSETKAYTGTEDRYFKLSTDNNKKEYQWQTVWYTGGSTDIFDIHATVLPTGSQFVIGDPRTDEVDNLTDEDRYAGLYIFNVNGTSEEARSNDLAVLETVRVRTGVLEYPDGRREGFNEADALYGDTWRRLQWYYPTERAPRTEHMVAPSYRISSKFSGTEFGKITMPYAEYRCAAYQEDGFPAGRWRLPTKSEVNFIAQLSAKGFFEFLFNSNDIYWSANGAIKVNDNGTVSNNDSQTALLRCVYDSWYWDMIDRNEGKITVDDPRHNPRDKFIWGDKQR